MEPKSNIFSNNFKEHKIPSDNYPANLNFISGKIINISDNTQGLNTFYAPSAKEKEKERQLLNTGEMVGDFLLKNFINKMTLVNSIPQQKLHKKRVIMENSFQEKEESFEEKVQKDIFPYVNKKKENDNNNREDLNHRDENKNIKNKNKKKSVKFKSEENNEKKEDIKIAYNHNRTFSNNIKDINNNQILNINYILSFFELTSKHLKEELEHDHTYYSDYHNSQNYIPKLTFELNGNKIFYNYNEKKNNILKNIENKQSNNKNLDISQKIFFFIYEQMNSFKNNNRKNNENISNNKCSNDFEANIINNHDEILYNSKNERKINIQKESTKDEKIKTYKENNDNIQSFISKNYSKNKSFNQYNQTQKIFNNKFPNNNNNINFQRNENNKFNINLSNYNENSKKNFKQNGEDLEHSNNILKNTNNQFLFNEDESNCKFNRNTKQKNLILPKKCEEGIILNMNDSEHNTNNQERSFQSINNQLKDSIPRNSNNMNNINDYINLYNINYNYNYINLINPIKKNQSPNRVEQANSEENDLTPQLNSILRNNQINYLNPNDYIVKMFGRFGWVCRICNNFNYETRIKCNRCHKMKAPKMKKEIFNGIGKRKTKKKNVKKFDWFCLNCQNINYSFRENCYKCKIGKKNEYFPSKYLVPNKKINDDNTRIMLMKTFDEMKICLNNNENHDNINNFVNNNKNNYTNNNISKQNINTLDNNYDLISCSNYFNN